MRTRPLSIPAKASVAAVIACAVAALGAPSALADATITSVAGPLTAIGITSDLNCSVNHTGDTAGEFFGDTACGTLVASGGTLYGPASIPAGGSASPLTPYTAVNQSAVTGSGTANSPYQISTAVDLATSGLHINETDAYIVGDESYRTSVQLSNTTGAPISAIIYRAGDCFLANSDSGFGAHDLSSGSVTCVESVDDGLGGTKPGTRIESWLPLSSGSHSFEAGYDAVWSKIGTQTEFDDSCLCDQDIDNGAGLSWAVTVPANSSVTKSGIITFSPTGHLPLTTTKTADAGVAQPSTSDGYTITVSNPNTSAVSLDTITDTLPTGFTYTAASTTGATTTNPAINGQNLTWQGPISVPAASGGNPGTASLHFNVTVSGTNGDYFNNAGGTATDYTVVGTGDTAEVRVGNTFQLTVSKSGNGSGSVSSSPAGISCGSTCSALFIAPDAVTLTPTAAAGSTFTGWSGDCTGTGVCQVTMSAAHAVTATFTLQTHTLSVSRAGTGSGSVSSAPAGISCGSTCSASYDHGAVVTLTPTASAGSDFTGWSGDCTGTGGCQVTMDQARAVTANFTLQTHTLNVSRGGTGSGSVASSPAGISCGATCSASYNQGTAVTLTPTAAAGSTFTGWSGDCTGTGACQVTMDANHSVTATFTANVVSPPTDVGGSVGGPGSVGSGDLFCGVQHRGKCKGLPVKGIFDRPGNAVWSFDAFNPSPGGKAAVAAGKKIRLGQIKRVIVKAGTVTVVFKLKKGAKTKKLYNQVKKAKLTSILVTLTFTSTSGHKTTTTKVIKLKK